MKVESQSLAPKCDLGSTNSGNGFGTFEKFHDLLNLFFGREEKFGKYIKVPILFVRGCNFT